MSLCWLSGWLAGWHAQASAADVRRVLLRLLESEEVAKKIQGGEVDGGRAQVRSFVAFRHARVRFFRMLVQLSGVGAAAMGGRGGALVVCGLVDGDREPH